MRDETDRTVIQHVRHNVDTCTHCEHLLLYLVINRDFFMGSALNYGIYIRVNLFSQNEQASATSEWVLRKQINRCINAIQKHFPSSNLFIL